ncbi:MAG: ribbon-helix-helix protein, CopG family [Meiothermus ruber]|jgi:hypothetical protein|uniref:ribbon-helix-helix protein, CopG family n=1 Tax=Meiothermus ruber TaxID=277 RepID=UPI0023F7CD5E|nr:ribbon-helix-helix protein, CopG family [Meiothermus ruber]MCL6531105.1 ribbon-helix-helix protein, CopG family [Meiothermus ruber]
MRMLDRRVQILLDADRYRRLAAEAAARGTSVAAVVREAIDRALPGDPTRRAAAARRILDAPDMPVPDVEELTAELRSIRSRRA